SSLDRSAAGGELDAGADRGPRGTGDRARPDRRRGDPRPRRLSGAAGDRVRGADRATDPGAVLRARGDSAAAGPLSALGARGGATTPPVLAGVPGPPAGVRLHG